MVNGGFTRVSKDESVPTRGLAGQRGQGNNQLMREPIRGHHDMGGLPAGPVERTEHDYAFWEKLIDAMNVLLASKGHLRVDEMRKNIEALPPDAYDRMTYYERWISAIANTLLQRGVITADELGCKMEEIARREGVVT